MALPPKSRSYSAPRPSSSWPGNYYMGYFYDSRPLSLWLFTERQVRARIYEQEVCQMGYGGLEVMNTGNLPQIGTSCGKVPKGGKNQRQIRFIGTNHSKSTNIKSVDARELRGYIGGRLSRAPCSRQETPPSLGCIPAQVCLSLRCIPVRSAGDRVCSLPGPSRRGNRLLLLSPLRCYS